MAKWRLSSTEPRTDGSGDVTFEVWGVDDAGNVIPGKHADILIDETAIRQALALPTNAQRNAALKTLVAAEMPDDWLNDALDAIVAANLAALEANGALDTYVAASLGGYPVNFSL